MGSPKVSIVVPVYNDAGYLEQSLRSALGQTLDDIEVVCVDDGSTDCSRQVIEQLAAGDPRLRLLSHTMNMGSSQARKDGVAASTGEYIMFLDADDELVPEACETAHAAIEEFQTDMVQFGSEVVDCGGVSRSELDARRRWLRPHPGRIEAENLVGACFVDKAFGFTLWNKIYRGDLCRASFDDVEDGSFSHGEDLYAFFAIACRARSYQGIEDRLYRYCYGRGVTVTDGGVMSLEGFDALLEERGVAEALERFVHDRGAEDQLGPALDGVRDNFAIDCTKRWLNNLSLGCTAEGFDRLVDAWGMEDVLCTLADRCRFDAAVPKKLLRTDRFRYEERGLGKRLHIAYQCGRSHGRGAGRVAVELCNLWAGAEDGHGAPLYDVTLIADEDLMDDGRPLDPRVRRERLPVRVEHGKGSYRDRHRVWQRIISDNGIDIVISGGWLDDDILWDLLSVKGAPARPAFLLHCQGFTMASVRREGGASRFMYLCRLCDGAAVISTCDRAYVGLFCANARCIPNPVAYVADNAPAEPEGSSIVWTGRISEEEQPLDLVRMMGKVVERVPDARLYVVWEGDGGLVSRMRGEASRLGLEGSIIFTGSASGVDAWYRKASVCVCTSKDGCPSPAIAESLSRSLPVVMYDQPWLTFVRDGRGIRTVEQGCYDLLADEVVRLLEDPEEARRLGCEGRGQIGDLLRVDIGAEWRELFLGIDPDARPSGWDTDERILFQYAAELQGEVGQKLLDENSKLESKLQDCSNALTARIDIKDAGAPGNDVEVLELSDPHANVGAPSWFCDTAGTGRVVTSVAGSLEMRLKCVGDGRLTIALRCLDVRDGTGERVPFWIDYTFMEVDGEPVVSEPESQVAWHDRPYRYQREVRDGEELVVSISWRPFNDGERLHRLEEENARLRAGSLEIGASEEVQALRSSATWKAGRFVTWLPRKVRELFGRA